MAKKDKAQTEILDDDINEVEAEETKEDKKSKKKEKTKKEKKEKKSKKAKDEDNEDIEDIAVDKPEKVKRKKGNKLLTVLLLLILIFSLIGYIFMFNGFGIRDKFLRPYLENVPFVSNYLPPETQPVTLGEVTLENSELKSQNELLQQQLDSANAVAQANTDELERLKLIEAQQTEFVKMKEEFDKNVAEMLPEEYIKYYEAMYPDIAEQAYSELISDKYTKAELDSYIATFQAMEPDAIAPILEEMMNTDVELVVLIMENIDKQLAGDTLAAMDPVNAAQIAKLMSPENQ